MECHYGKGWLLPASLVAWLIVILKMLMIYKWAVITITVHYIVNIIVRGDLLKDKHNIKSIVLVDEGINK